MFFIIEFDLYKKAVGRVSAEFIIAVNTPKTSALSPALF